jgi:mRNA interferase RelE/StbE
LSTEPAPWRIEITRTAQRDLRRLDPPVRQRVAAALQALAVDPHRAGQLRKLTGAPESRLRVGDWRALVLLDEPNRVIQLTRVLPRGRAYRD